MEKIKDKPVVNEDEPTTETKPAEESDIILYNGAIDDRGADKLVAITSDTKNKSVLFLLCTLGGDAHAAFKIARRLQEKYEKFSLYIYGYCKSAGTLIAIGSDEIVMSDYAEFGPLDVQLAEKDEMIKLSSGLNVDEAIRTLKEEALDFFRSAVLELVAGANISTKTATEVATNLAIGFISPLVSQIDPIRVGEIHRATKIALAYGERLIEKRGNIGSDKQLAHLVQGYPDHGFVIDFQEAKHIFKNVRKHTVAEAAIGESLKDSVRYPSMKQNIIKLERKEAENRAKTIKP